MPEFHGIVSPAQHGVWLRDEDGGVHHEARVVHDESDPLGPPDAADAQAGGDGGGGGGLLGVLVDVHHLAHAQALEGPLGAGQAAVAAAQHPAAAGAAGRHPLGPRAAGPRGRGAGLPLWETRRGDCR